MSRKMIGIITGMLVVILVLPSVATAVSFGNKKDVFKECYIEATGEIEPTGSSYLRYVMWKHFWFRPYGDDRAFVFLWRIAFMEPNVTVSIYSEKNGDLLWQDTGLTGIWGLKLFWFYGTYTNEGTTEDHLVINIKGNIKAATVYSGE